MSSLSGLLALFLSFIMYSLMIAAQRQLRHIALFSQYTILCKGLPPLLQAPSSKASPSLLFTGAPPGSGTQAEPEFINNFEQDVVFLGDGVPVFRDYIEGHCQVPYTFAPAHMNKQRAAAVAALGQEYYRSGRVQTAAEHCPEYLRLAQAERERLAAAKAEAGKAERPGEKAEVGKGERPGEKTEAGKDGPKVEETYE